jgi:hypothetical protein
MTTEIKRDLVVDMAICDAASSAVWINEGNYVVEYDRLTEEGCDLISECERECDAIFTAEAREGWVHAIRRAITAEAEVARLRAELQSTVDCIDDYYDHDADDIPLTDILDAIRDGARAVLQTEANADDIGN